jgi:hypothetical protein
LCGKKPTTVGTFVPPESLSKQLGAPEGKTRVFPYGICDECQKQPGWLDEVEKKIVKSMTIQLVSAPGTRTKLSPKTGAGKTTTKKKKQ